MTISKKYVDLIVDVTSNAAISASNFIGKKDKNLADQAAVNSMRAELNKLNIDGKVVIGEGELDEAPMLYIGEKIGNGKGLLVDIAVDPLEGTNFVANDMPGGLSVISIAERGNLFQAPETYMDKIAYGKNIPFDAIDLDFPIEKNLRNLSEVTNKNIKDLTVCILDRPRHKELISQVRSTGARIKLIPDGDVSAVIATSIDESGIDIYMGTGGSPEGVLAAAALRCMGGKIYSKLIYDNDDSFERAKKMGVLDKNQVFETNDLAKGDVMFSATGVTDGTLLKGVRIKNDSAHTHSVVMRSQTNTVRYIKAKHNLNIKMYRSYFK